MPFEDSRRWEERRTAIADVLGICQAVLWGSSEQAKTAREYLHSRGFSDDDIKGREFGLYPTIGRLKIELHKLGGS